MASARAADQRCVTFRVGGAFLNASYNGEITTSATALDSERFLPVSESDVTVLREMLTNDWVIRSSGDLVKASEVSLGLWYSFRFGELSFDLRFQGPFDRSAWPFRLTLLRDGWRIERICLYRPLIYFTAYGPSSGVGPALPRHPFPGRTGPV